MTRIRIFTQFGDLAYQPGTNRVQVDVANQFKKIGIFLNNDAFVAILEEVAFSIVALIVPDSVASHEPPHHGRKKHYAGSHKEVKVIGHQAPGKQRHGGDPQFTTEEGYAKWHYDNYGRKENRPLKLEAPDVKPKAQGEAFSYDQVYKALNQMVG